MHATHDETVELSSPVDISAHALLRAQQRLGAVGEAAERIRELLDRAEPVEVDYVRGAQAYQVGSVTIVVGKGANGQVVQTVLKEVED